MLCCVLKQESILNICRLCYKKILKNFLHGLKFIFYVISARDHALKIKTYTIVDDGVMLILVLVRF